MTPKEQATKRAEDEVRKFFDATIPESKRLVFWATAKINNPILTDELNVLKRQIDAGEKDIQEHCLLCKLFENKSKFLIRSIALEVLLKKH